MMYKEADHGNKEIPAYMITGYSGTGKTTFIEKMIPAFKSRGFKVAVAKQSSHECDVDKKGKDSWRFTNAGADVTVLASVGKTVIMENREVDFKNIISDIKDVDIILMEGNQGEWPKIMLYREEVGKPFSFKAEDCLAVVSDRHVKDCKYMFGFGEIEPVVDFIISDWAVRSGRTAASRE